MQVPSVKYLLASILIGCFLCGFCQEKKFDPYNESNYKEISRGKYKETGWYAIIFQNEIDSQYSFVKIFDDSSYNSKSYIQQFEYKGQLDGPLEGFLFGKQTGKWLYKNGKRHGECIMFQSDGTISTKEFYNMGKKVGVWEFYDSHGRVFKKKYYKDDKFIKQEIYNRNGKLARTEFEESTLY